MNKVEKSGRIDILVVDDTVANLNLLASILREVGYAVRAASRPEFALESALAHPPALVLLDVRMPNMDGFEVCRRLKHDDRTRDVPIIFVSGMSDLADRVQGFAVGGVDFISKPIQREEVLARVGTHLALREAQQVLEQRVRERTAELEQSMTRLRETELAMDLAGIGIHLLDGESGRFLYVNDYFCRTHGFTRNELLSMTILELEPMLPALPFPEIAAPFRLKGHDRFETVHRHKDGHDFPVEITLYYRAPDEGAQGHFIAFMSDITDRKKSEEDLRRSETKFRTLYHSTSDAVMLLDEKGFIDCNQATLTLFGCASVEEFCTKHPADVSPPDQPDGTSSLILANQRVAEAKKEGSLHFEWTHKRVDTGGPFPSEVLLNALELDGKPLLQATVRNISERKAAEKEIEQLAFYDPLTGLPNRRLLIDRMQQAMVCSARSGRLGALLFIDLDNFKTINDSMGHDIGDQLLKQISQRLETCVRAGDTVARLGGDEFVVMLEDLSEDKLEAAAQAEQVGGKILAALSQPCKLAGHDYHGTTSVGATLLHANPATGDDLMRQADIALYQAKNSGRNTMRFFDPEMQKIIEARASLESDLRKALENDQFQLHYQIQVDHSGRPLGAESLIRWIHPERGLVSPAQFIPLAEDTGLILPIGAWVLETACAQLKAWESDALTRDLCLAVNVSPRQFHQADFEAQVQATLQRHGINPKLLELELTEGMVLVNVDATIATMNSLSKQGIRFSLDDFGTGYSSLQYLKRLPLDQLKIDHSFVRDIVEDGNDLAIVTATIAIARSLKLDVIAEGVETEAQRELLLKNGCSHYQGYLFSKPVPVEQFEALLKRQYRL